MGDLWAAVTAISTVALWLTTVVTARYALRGVNQARADSLHRLRPVVSLHLEKSVRGGKSLDLLVTNTGSTPAIDVLVTLPELDVESGEVVIARIFSKAPFILAPGQTQRFPWTCGREGEPDFEGRHVVQISYESAINPGPRYREQHPIDTDFYFLYDHKALAPEKIKVQ